MTERTGKVVVSLGWLIGCVVVGILCFWYPSYVDSKFGEEVDSGMGFLYLWGFPFMIGAAVMAVVSQVRLYRALRGAPMRDCAPLISAGGILTLAALSPAAVIAFRLVYGIIQLALWNRQHG